jgi:hypothetical protein
LNKLGYKIEGTMEKDHFGRAYKSYYLVEVDGASK